LDITRLSGEIEIKEIALDIKKDSISALAVSSNRVVALKGTLKGKFDDLGVIGIGDTQGFIDVVSLFKSEIDITLNKNKLTLKEGTLKANTTLKSSQYVNNGIPEDKFNQLYTKVTTEGKPFVLEIENLKKIVDYLATIKSTEIEFSGKKDAISINAKNVNDDITDDLPIKFDGEFSIKLGKAILEVLSVMNEKVTITAKEPNPVLINLKKDSMEINLLVAPLKA